MRPSPLFPAAVLAAVSILGISSSIQGQTLSFDSTTLISSNSNFDLSVYPGKAEYSGLASGTFGDSSVEAYGLWTNPSSGSTIARYADDGSGVISAATNTNNPPSYELARGDVWVVSDPDIDAADFGGATETISGGQNVTGAIDITSFDSGTVYVLCGGYDTAFNVTLTMTDGSGGDIVAADSVDPPPSRNMYVFSFSFESGDYETINFAYTGSTGGRARFMGVVLDAEITPGVILWSSVATSAITSTTADALGSVSVPLTDCFLVWDSSDMGDSSVGDWGSSSDLGAVAAGPISGQLTGLSADTSYTWRLFGSDGVGEGWTAPQTFATALTGAQAPAFTSTWLTTGTLDVNLAWQDNAATETSYELLRSTDGVSFSALASLAPDTVSYVDEVPAPGVTYYYRLSAANVDNGSSTDPALCATSISVPTPAIYAASTTSISQSTDFDLSLYPGKASYSGLASGAFGDGSVEAYSLWANSAVGVVNYANDGSGILSPISYSSRTTFANFERGDVWTISDPGSLSGGIPSFATTADFGGATLTISGAYNVTGSIDISGFSSGTVYILCGGYDTPFNVAATLTGGAGPDISGDASVDPGTTRNMYVFEFPFVSGDFDTINYAYTGSASNRSRFMGVIVDGVTDGGGGDTAYTTWAGSNGLTEGVNDGQGQDADNGGKNNFYEFAFGGDPLDGNDDGSLMHHFVADADGDTDADAVLTVLVRSGGTWSYSGPAATATVDGVVYTIKGSASLPVSGAVNVLEGTTVITTGLPAAPGGYEYKSFILDGSTGEGLPSGYFQVMVEAG